MNDVGLREAVELLGRVAKAEIAERDERIAELQDEIRELLGSLEASDREKELLRARIDELMPSVDEYGTLVREIDG